MNSEQLKTLCSAVFGEHWQTDLSRRLGVSPRTLRRWANEGWPIPKGAREDILQIAKTQAHIIQMTVKAIESGN